MRTLVEMLCDLPGAASAEDAVRAVLLQRAKAAADEVRVDAMGSVIVSKHGRRSGGPRVALCAHMDEVGLIIRTIEAEGHLRFSCIGPIDRRVLIGKPVRVGPKGIPGVIGLKAYHLVSEEEEQIVPKTDSLYIDIGADSREKAEEQVSLGDICVFDTKAEQFGDGLIKAKALDSRVGCAVLLTLMEEELPLDCDLIFSAQKKVGHRGAFGAAFSAKPEIALVLDGASAADLPGVGPHQQGCQVGRGPVLSLMDRGMIADRALFELLRSLAEEDHIPWQFQRPDADDSDAGTIQRTRNGIRTATLGIPVRYLDTPAAVASFHDIEQMLALTRALIGAVTDQVV